MLSVTARWYVLWGTRMHTGSLRDESRQEGLGWDRRRSAVGWWCTQNSTKIYVHAYIDVFAYISALHIDRHMYKRVFVHESNVNSQRDVSTVPRDIERNQFALWYDDGERTSIVPKLLGENPPLLCTVCQLLGQVSELKGNGVHAEPEKRVIGPSSRWLYGYAVYIYGLTRISTWGVAVRGFAIAFPIFTQTPSEGDFFVGNFPLFKIGPMHLRCTFNSLDATATRRL